MYTPFTLYMSVKQKHKYSNIKKQQQLLGICIFASAYDVIFQILHPANKGDVPNYQNLAVFGGSYVLLGLLATIFGFSRYVTVKLARQAIPKAYMPISQEDLPKKVYEFVQLELDRVAKLAKKATPTLEESAQPGWGKPGNESFSPTKEEKKT